jgi:branched-chain amino acid transport system ATP-binding protein
MLELRDLHVNYGAISALHGISLEVKQGEIVTLIGANGAGKSTTLRAISGLVKPRSGVINFDGHDIAGLPAHTIVGRGLAQSPEGRMVFANLSVIENLRMALMSQPKCLMLDEPSLGIAPILVQTIFEKVVEVNRQLGLTILLVEQNANLALEISHRGYVLETGRIILTDTAAALRDNAEVRECYLGGEA